LSRRRPYPRVTFGIIVLNGEPFTRYCLRSIYPFAHQIIVVEGGHEGARAATTEDGHSLDDTLAILRRFKEEEDPLGKVEIVTRDGFWPQKDELGHDRTPQSRAYAERATGDYLWQVDIDEFYRAEDMARILTILRSNPRIGMISFRQRTFWGHPDYEVDCWPLRRRHGVVHRVFRWGPGYQYVTHEPPTVLDGEGRDLRSLERLRPGAKELEGIYMYHYSLLFPWQVEQKTRVYRDEKPESCAGIVDWAEHSYLKLEHPYHVHNLYQSPSWLQRYRGEHPVEVARMMSDGAGRELPGGLRATADVERMLNAWWYPCGREALKVLDYVDRLMRWLRLQALRAAHAPRKAARAAGHIAAHGRDGSRCAQSGAVPKRPGRGS
jgi:hypothetical protein